MSAAITALCAELQSVIATAINEHRQGALFADVPVRLQPPSQERSVAAATEPVVDEWLARSISAAAHGPWQKLARLLGEASPDLPWLRSYENLETSPELEAFRGFYSYQVFAGPIFRGHEPAVLVDDLLVGFSLQAPDIFYPQHHHEPPELYGVISGHLKWQVGERWSTVAPGDVIVHRSHESHAMKTGAEPALTWVAWPRNPHTSVYMPSMDPPQYSMPPQRYD